MSPKTMIMIGMVAGTYLGGYVPTLLGADTFSMWSIIGSMIGGVIGVVLGYKITKI
jgi:outer membrane lipoprotein SlyB